MSTTFHEALFSLLAQPVTRPAGLIEKLHFGYALRYGLDQHRQGWQEWHTLEEMASTLDARQLSEVLPVLAARAWEAGSQESFQLSRLLWPQLSPQAQGDCLAGMARHLSNLEPAEERMLADFFLNHLPSTALSSQALAEIAANAMRSRQSAILDAALAHRDFDPEAVVERLDPAEDRFENEISQHATRTVDLLLECSVRCLQAEATERLLAQGASPDLPCWNLERSFSEWFSLLSYSLHSLGNTEKDDEPMRIFDLLLQHGADPRGLACEGLNHPLKLALDKCRWNIADRLLDMGASFTGGRELLPKDFEKPGRLIPAGHPHYAVLDDDLQWVETKIAPLVSLLKPWQAPLFYRGDAQGGKSSTFLSSLLSEQDMQQLKHFESRGLPTGLTPALFIQLVNGGHCAALIYLLRNETNLPHILFRARCRNPELGILRLQAWLSQPQDDRINELPDFDPGDQVPLELPDGSRYYLYLDAVAPPDHDHGPLTSGCFWLQEHQPVHRRRRDRVIIRCLQRIWRMEKLPEHDYALMAMMPLVKEVNGRHFLPGVSARHVMFGQAFPVESTPLVRAWLNGPFEQAMRDFRQRISDQLANTSLLPEPVLSVTELKPYPEEFWPYLRRLEDGTIGVTQKSTQPRPEMHDIITIWARQNKPPQDFTPDPRVVSWSLWSKVPLELQPYFVWDDLFQKPTVTHESRNDYDRAMIHQAVQWNNSLYIEAFKEAGM
jgi:hypothetical protein